MTEIAKPSDNRHPADELAELRQQLRRMGPDRSPILFFQKLRN
jgi:hypothetical protein